MAIPSVSVVLPVWNGERFLSAAIESILRQTFESFELLLIDDGSTDGTSRIAHDHAARDSRIRVFTRAHEGLVSALNFGVAESRGRYIARIDADDICFPMRFDRQVAWLDSDSRCVAVGSWIEVIDEESRHVGFRAFARHHDEIVSALLLEGNPMVHPSVMIRRDALRSVNGYADRYPSEDLDLWLRLSRVGRLANLPEVLLRHRRHARSVSLRERERQLDVKAGIVEAERRSRGLSSLGRTAARGGGDPRSSYHANCAATALVGGPRLTALRHAIAGIASSPFRHEAWSLLLACILPRALLRLLAATIHQKRGLLFPGALYAPSLDASSSGSAKTGIGK